jgi:hypothetical protein
MADRDSRRRNVMKAAAVAMSGLFPPLFRTAGAAQEAPTPAVPAYQSDELVALFKTYTGGPTSIGANLTRLATEAGGNDPLIVVTGADMAIYPGGGRLPTIASFRLSTRGFLELAGISHLGPAMGSLVNMRAMAPKSELWRNDIHRLTEAVTKARAANSVDVWRDRIAVEAYRGKESQIADMVDYACGLTLRYIKAAKKDENVLSPEFLRHEYLEAKGDALGATVPFNDVMIATFFLVALDISHRTIGWFRAQGVDWSRAMVLITGQQGRPTAGVTWTTNSVAQLILSASGGKLPLERLYIAPHENNFEIKDLNNPASIAPFELSLRQLWCGTRATSELAPTMFDGFPRFAPGSYTPPVVTKMTREVSEMPSISGPNDVLAMTTRLRVVIEDPRQLLSGCVTDYAAQQLMAVNNDPAQVIVPGLDNRTYPRRD